MPPTRRSNRPVTNTAPYSQANDHRSSAGSSRAVRSTRNPRALVEPDSDIDDELGKDVGEDDEMEEDELDVEDDEDDDMGDEDAEGEDDDDEDIVVRGHPPPPKITTHTNPRGKPQVVVRAPNEGPLKSVEAKEMEDEGDLSDLNSDEDDDEDGPDQTNLNDDDDIDIDDDDALGETDEEASQSGTPDPNKLTRRQRGQFEDFDGGLLALSNEAQKKKHISAEEHAMRRAEMARRRKNLSEKRNEEEKIDTINKLLKKPAPKRRTRAEMLAAQLAEASTPGVDGEDGETPRADPLYVRWVSNASGSRIGVPVEWLESPIASALADPNVSTNAPSSTIQSSIRVEEVA